MFSPPNSLERTIQSELAWINPQADPFKTKSDLVALLQTNTELVDVLIRFLAVVDDTVNEVSLWISEPVLLSDRIVMMTN
ncbi:hypothetical protein, partial [Endozoicomonas sp. SESOKO3]|uniref:hypothetical protein n=1 Tax=Endozoicomonas sp. SESOKO3 TaxID=2828744 RepID=UPI00214775D4